jgi:hypothetical protein
VIPWEIAIYNRLVKRGLLKLRCYAMLGDERNPEFMGDLASYFRENRQDDEAQMFSVRSVKLFVDGAHANIESDNTPLSSPSYSFITPTRARTKNIFNID